MTANSGNVPDALSQTGVGERTRALIQAVKRNIQRIPEDFMFQLTRDEVEVLKSQNLISKPE
jgi:hypothetical protein